MPILERHDVHMKSATIAELRNHFSGYLRKVARGERFLVRRRNEIVAEIGPPSRADAHADSESLEPTLVEIASQGGLRLGTGRLPEWCLRPLSGAGANLLAAVLEEREHGR